MTETGNPPAAAPDVNDEDAARPGPTRLWRVARVVSLAAVLIALYAFTQLRSDDDDPATAARAPSGPPAAGVAAPDIDVPLFDGGRFNLREHLAVDRRPVFLNMWASWCFPCRAEMPDIDAVAAEHPEIYFIGIAVDDRESPARDFVEKRGISYDIGIDERPVDDEEALLRGEGRAVEKAYTVWAMPTTYLIGSDGIIIERWFGPMGRGQLEDFVALAGTPAS